MRRRILTGATLALATALSFFLAHRAPHGTVAWLVGTLLALGGAWELARLGRFEGFGFGAPLFAAWAGTAALALAVLTARAGEPSPLLAWLLLVAASAGIAGAGLFGENRAEPGAPRLLPLLLAAGTLPPLLALSTLHARLGTSFLVSLIALAKIGDNLGYFVGRSIGKRHPFPRLSPNKTVAGCVASLVGGVVAGGVLQATGLLGVRYGLPGGLAFGGAVNVASQLGDLGESWIKRRAGAKDSGTLFGASGGVLDVVDSLFGAVPAAILLTPLLLPAA